MPPGLASKGKGKARDARRSRSRNTTPSSVLSSGTAPPPSATTPYLEIDSAKLLVPITPQYSDMLDRLDGKPGFADPKHLETLVEQLRQLSELAEARAQVCDAAMRDLASKRKDFADEERERERVEREADLRRAKMAKEVEDLHHETASKKISKLKKRKDRLVVAEERPIVHAVDGVEVKTEDELEKPRAIRAITSPGPTDSPSPSKKAKLSPGTSSLSEIAQSPEVAPGLEAQPSPSKSDASMDTSDDDRQNLLAPPVAQHTFFPDPLAPDPVIYHIRDINPGMTDEEKKEIYSVRGFPTKDLSDQIAGTPPDKDFSNAKPTNQVAANTFLTYAEPYVRPLTEEDIAFLRERGDRTTPFLSVPRGKRHYTSIWAEEDGTISLDSGSSDKLSPNQARGSIDQLNDDTITTDQVSAGPLANRLLSLLRFEHRSQAGDNNATSTTNGDGINGFTSGSVTDSAMDLDGLTNGHDLNSEKSLPPAASVADLAPGPKTPSSSTSTSQQKTDYVQADERIKQELRYLNFLGPDENPDYDAHHDDDISERLRLLQGELRRVMITNGARKARLLDIAKERLAWQEYNTIHEDLDSQVQQAYLKRTRTLGKTKKGGSGGSSAKPRPGGHVVTAAGGGAGATGSGPGAAGVGGSNNRARDIGDNARMLMDRRKRWMDCIGPVFRGMKQGIPGKGSSLWDPRVMEAYEKAEMEGFEDEGE